LQCGTNHTLAISEIGTLWSCGHNAKGQLGVGNRLDSPQLRPVSGALRGYRVVAAAAGMHHSMVLSADGSLFTWGSGSYGQLGHAQLHAVHLMQGNVALVVEQPRKLESLDPSKLQPWKRMTAISSGKSHCMGVSVCGELFAWGRNKVNLARGMDGWMVRSSIQRAPHKQPQPPSTHPPPCTPPPQHSVVSWAKATRRSAGPQPWCLFPGRASHPVISGRLRWHAVPTTPWLWSCTRASSCHAPQVRASVIEVGWLLDWGCGQ